MYEWFNPKWAKLFRETIINATKYLGEIVILQ